ncbi:hypothetical protein CVT26_007554 [Gymnopilus dilepis]|uniref:Retrotransposon gag domain-containing protein n=1 Tax=Gymnopilus dilepis TaxID=231916 RepID=A0A409WWK6_9AGAR|nr:hypothetical protein CVT26_007554 [Gymnopilus dilepis]
MITWIEMNRDKFLAEDYLFETFMADMRSRFLEPGWEINTLRKYVYVRMMDDQSFEDYATRIILGNTLVTDKMCMAPEKL